MQAEESLGMDMGFALISNVQEYLQEKLSEAEEKQRQEEQRIAEEKRKKEEVCCVLALAHLVFFFFFATTISVFLVLVLSQCALHCDVCL